ncbi:hypothetical protein [Chryseobacterium chendengshani]|uniref:hypothetical protein n=1 Tax=unclassified Chryseobacterium TaxID=2593645 RepID=UPI001C63C9B0|nr:MULTISPECIES: hypothetical protein [unclassified Chryseobacterium]MBW7676601.1 hypothetical protein [Chryseobacterium sp. LJ756]MBW8523143.1 hypothetical protein [Chryseobacterium sp. LJ668]QYK15442.1 hypothetical protein K0U91_10220 [Chryseobacterium sp. LJ668]
MKRIIIICTIIISGFASAQQQTSDNNSYVYETEELPEGDVFPGNPADPAPVDQYIPVLFLVAAAMIFTYAQKKKIAK